MHFYVLLQYALGKKVNPNLPLKAQLSEIVYVENSGFQFFINLFPHCELKKKKKIISITIKIVKYNISG